MRLRRPRVSELRAAWWARRALHHAHGELAGGEMRHVRLAPPPPLPAGAGRAVEAVLRLSRSTCLESALVRQRWLAAHGIMRDIVIGVTAPGAGFAAHAWVEVDPDRSGDSRWHELTRLAP